MLHGFDFCLRTLNYHPTRCEHPFTLDAACCTPPSVAAAAVPLGILLAWGRLIGSSDSWAHQTILFGVPVKLRLTQLGAASTASTAAPGLLPRSQRHGRVRWIGKPYSCQKREKGEESWERERKGDYNASSCGIFYFFKTNQEEEL